MAEGIRGVLGDQFDRMMEDSEVAGGLNDARVNSGSYSAPVEAVTGDAREALFGEEDTLRDEVGVDSLGTEATDDQLFAALAEPVSDEITLTEEAAKALVDELRGLDEAA